MTQRLAIYPGRFDPITLGHLDVITRASALFDQCVVAVIAGDQGRWPDAIRAQMVEESVAHLGNVSVQVFSGLLVECAHTLGACAIVRGLRNSDDFYDEYRMSVMNKQLSKQALETVFLLSSPKVSAISATLVREIIKQQGSVTPFVPAAVLTQLEREGYGA